MNMVTNSATSKLALRVAVPPAQAIGTHPLSTVLSGSTADRARVSLTMIVKDEEKNLPILLHYLNICSSGILVT